MIVNNKINFFKHPTTTDTNNKKSGQWSVATLHNMAVE